MPGRRFRNNKAGVSDWADSDHPLGLLLQVLGNRLAMPLLAALYLGLHRFDELERWTGLHPVPVSDRLCQLQPMSLLKMRLYQELSDSYPYILQDRGTGMLDTRRLMHLLGAEMRRVGGRHNVVLRRNSNAWG